MKYYNELAKTQPLTPKTDISKSEILSNMSCDVRTQLNGILGLAQLILKSKVVSANIRNDLKKIVEDGNTLLTTFDGIMDILKVDAGEMKANNNPVVLNSAPTPYYNGKKYLETFSDDMWLCTSKKDERCH